MMPKTHYIVTLGIAAFDAFFAVRTFLDGEYGWSAALASCAVGIPAALLWDAMNPPMAPEEER